MCGIAGISWNNKDLVWRMMEALAHRGPDQYGMHVEDGCSLGHRRLSIIDLSENGQQPMSNEDGSVWITFNGEIYNYRELRDWLEGKGHKFKSRTDTEVIVHAYEELGTRCLERLNGMFAFAIWDKKHRRLFLGRDRLGEKPLYYSFHEGKFVFASEIKAILQNPAVTREIDEQALSYFLGFEFVPAPLTMFKGIRKLRAGHYLLLSMGTLKEVRYWDLPAGRLIKRRKDWEEELCHRLETAVKIRMRSDVPMGAFLSGGIDSSSVVAMMRRATNGPVRTFALGYQQQSFSEFAYARRVADHFGTIHTELLIDPVTPEVIEQVIWHLDEPLSEFSVLPYYLICKKARQHVTVCLSGEGGDELFVGYDRFKASKANRIYARFPSWFRSVAASLMWRLSDRPQKKGITNSLKRFVEGASLPAAGGHMRWQYFLTRQHGAGLLGSDTAERVIIESLGLLEQIMDQCGSADPLEREIYAELKFMMPENPLMKVDKMSMAHSLEIRAPLLDHELVEFVSEIPADLKLNGWTTKSILKSSVQPLLPGGIAYRAKQGYSLPIKHWFRKELREYMEAILHGSAFIRDRFPSRYIEILFSEHLSGRQNHNHILWGLLNLALWHSLYFSREARRQAGPVLG
jgi:asparagine synthase (glutamine-hydrolysing)